MGQGNGKKSDFTCRRKLEYPEKTCQVGYGLATTLTYEQHGNPNVHKTSLFPNHSDFVYVSYAWFTVFYCYIGYHVAFFRISTFGLLILVLISVIISQSTDLWICKFFLPNIMYLNISTDIKILFFKIYSFFSQKNVLNVPTMPGTSCNKARF